MTELQSEREAQDLSQVELAHRSGVHPSTVSRCEAGLRPSPGVAASIAGALGTTPDALWPRPRLNPWDEARQRAAAEREAVVG
jgi:transcriptional regulator with XRE-family HTH domain